MLNADPHAINPKTGQPYSKMDEIGFSAITMNGKTTHVITYNDFIMSMRRMLLCIDNTETVKDAKHKAHQEFIKILAEKDIMIPPVAPRNLKVVPEEKPHDTNQ